MKGDAMDLLGLRYFQAVARREHLSRAAAELRVAQPSLSRSIARLESELGVPLFDRHGRRVRLNRFGAAFLSRVDRALAELDDARQELADAAGLDRGSIAVAAETLRPLTGLLQGFLAEHPEVDLRLFELDADSMTERLRAGEIDIGFASQQLTGPGLRSVEVSREEVLVAVPPGHALAAHTSVTIETLADQAMIVTHPGHWLRVLVDRMFAQARLSPHIVCESNEPTVMLELISAGLGVGFGPATARAAITRTPVAWLSVKAPDFQRVLTMVWREDTYLSTAARHLRDFAGRHRG
jgi:DNA-binding transcriptional LysR family regulator